MNNLIIEMLSNPNLNLNYVIYYENLQNFKTKYLISLTLALSNFHYCNRRSTLKLTMVGMIGWQFIDSS